MKLIQKLLVAVSAALVVTAVSAEQMRPTGPTRASHSEFFKSKVAMVLVARDEPAAIFALTLAIEKPLPSGSTVRVEFENPNSPDSPFVVDAVPDANGNVAAQSPKFEGIQNKRSYLARTRVIGADRQVVSVHEQWIWFDMPKELRSAYATKIVD
jgi:hypothetical protein